MPAIPTGYSLTDFAYQASRDLGCLRAGQSMAVDIIHDILIAGNQMMDSWLIDQLMVPANPAQVFDLIPGQQIYTIGPSHADFIADRPVEIEDANIILNTVTPVLRIPLNIINVDQWASIQVQQLPNALPLELYYEKSFDKTYGFSRILIWPGPLTGYQIELFAWDQSVLNQFADATTAYIYPPGYVLAIRKNLAVAIAPLMTMYSKSARAEHPMAPSTDMLQMVIGQAREAKEAVQSYNAPDPILTGDPAFMSRSSQRGFNWLLGTNGRNWR